MHTYLHKIKKMNTHADYHGTINGVTMNSEGCSNKCWDRSACTVTLVEDGTGTAKVACLILP